MHKLSMFIDKGDHSVGFYKNPVEKKDLIVSYFRSGLALGEKCLLICTPEEYQKIHQVLLSMKIDGYPNEKKIDFIDSVIYVDAIQKKDAASLRNQWRKLMDSFLNEGFSAIRGVGCLPDDFQFTDESKEFLLDYESAVSELFNDYPVSAVCLYPHYLHKTPFGKALIEKACHPVVALSIPS